MRFSKPPAVPFNAHRPVMDFEDLEDIFTWQEARTLSASLTLQYDKVLYLVEPLPENQRLAGKRMNVIESRWTDCYPLRRSRLAVPRV
jgi:hypothetical protein